MFCPKCGVKTGDGARFCTGCGAPLAVNPADVIHVTKGFIARHDQEIFGINTGTNDKKGGFFLKEDINFVNCGLKKL